MSFGEELRRHRLNAGLTQEELAQRAGLSVRGLSDLERDVRQTPYRDTVERLAAALGVDDTARLKLLRSRRRFAPRAAEGGQPGTAISEQPLLRRRQQLPAELSSFIAREDDVSTVAQQLAAARLVTLTGPGGVGKTRLALRVAEYVVEQFADGGLFVPLAPITDPLLVTSTIAQLLGVREAGGRPLLAMLKDVLRQRQLLLLLDNFEQVLVAAPLVPELLTSCPRLKVLVTSRAILHVSGEQTFAVPPLAVPERHSLLPVDQLLKYAAVRLFVDRAVSAKHNFALTHDNATAVAETCSRLDGLPLAIELAAVRVRVLTGPSILAHIGRRLDFLVGGARDAPERHQTLRAAIDWSYDLLTPPEQTLFRHLAVFVGGCTVEAVEALTDMSSKPGSMPRSEVNVLTLLSSLVEQNLLRVSEPSSAETRFELLETVREYALERLRSAGEEVTFRRRHRDWCLTLAQRAEPELWGSDQLTWMDRLEAEFDNIWAALDWSKQDPLQPEAGLRLAAALWRFWDVRGHLSAGRAQLTGLLDLVPKASQARARGLCAAGYLAFRQGEVVANRVLTEQGLALGYQVGDDWVVRWTLMGLGATAFAEGHLAHASTYLQDSLALGREARDPILSAVALFWLGNLAQTQKDYQFALSCFDECRSLSRARGDRWMSAFASSGLGRLALIMGDLVHAVALHRESLRLHYQLQDQSSVADSLDELALVAAAQDQRLRAARLFGAADTARERIAAFPWPGWGQTARERTLAALRGRVGEQAFAAANAEGRAWSTMQAANYALGNELPISTTEACTC